MVNRELLEAVRSQHRDTAAPVRAAGAQAYMKSVIPSLGVRVPEVRRPAAAAVARYPFDSAEQVRATVLELWRTAGFREERYAAIDLTANRLVAADLQMLPVYEEIIRKGAWWDFVEVNPTDSEFFIRKAIGWSLPVYAKTAPDWVADFVAAHEGGITPLSRREALKNLAR
jgi:3-methyladenine DNA glycosylase AlkD